MAGLGLGSRPGKIALVKALCPNCGLKCLMLITAAWRTGPFVSGETGKVIALKTATQSYSVLRYTKLIGV